MVRRKGLDRYFLQYGIRQEDLEEVEKLCLNTNFEINPDWMKENIIKAYQTKKNEGVPLNDQNEVVKIIKQAIKKIK